jgi:hypothetical protein
MQTARDCSGNGTTSHHFKKRRKIPFVGAARDVALRNFASNTAAASQTSVTARGAKALLQQITVLVHVMEIAVAVAARFETVVQNADAFEWPVFMREDGLELLHARAEHFAEVADVFL